jgi:hypothetical protein
MRGSLSRLPDHKSSDAFDFTPFKPDLDSQDPRDLAALEFVTSHSNIALLGLRVSVKPRCLRLLDRPLDSLHGPGRSRRQRRAAKAACRFTEKLQINVRPAV